MHVVVGLELQRRPFKGVPALLQDTSHLHSHDDARGHHFQPVLKLCQIYLVGK